MGQGICRRMAAAFTAIVLGLSPAFGMDRPANDAGAVDREAGASPGVNSDPDLGVLACPTRFDYLVLASFADAPSFLSFSTYHSRSEARFTTVPFSRLMRVDYQLDSAAGDCRSRGFGRRT